jgi:8-oxo-dGTP diphosphatase
LAKLIQFRLVRKLMVWTILVVVPRHRMGVEIVLFNERRQVLLLNHVFHPEIPWGVPGGWLDRNEDPAEGVLRELREETGLTAVLGQIIMIKRQKRPSHLGAAYLAYAPQGTLTLSNEIIEAAWTDLNNLPKLMPFTQEAIEKAAILYEPLMVRAGNHE